MRRWLKGEPKLSDVLADPVIQMMMRRDRVRPDHLRDFLRRVDSARVSADFVALPAGFADLECQDEDAFAG